MSNLEPFEKLQHPISEKSAKFQHPISAAHIASGASTSSGGTFRNKWIPRLFILAIAPSIAMIIALLFFPQSQIAKCPLLVPSGSSETATGLPPRTDSSESPLPIIDISGHLFEVNNTTVFRPPIPESESGLSLIFLGIVLDVRSGLGYYGPEGAYYNLTKDGIDVTRGLLLSSLVPENLTDDISDLLGVEGKEKIRNQLTQWLSFFLNKYPQKGVLVGRYWTLEGQPTTEWLEIVSLLRERLVDMDDTIIPRMFECQLGERGDDLGEHQLGRLSVFCAPNEGVPKIIRHRGKSQCACVDENEIFSVKTPQFAVVHFDDCNDDSSICWPMEFELDSGGPV
jgi:hypothetical protein